MFHPNTKHLILGSLLAFLIAPRVWAIEPCCTIVAIDSARQVVTALDKTTGKAFQFNVKNKALLATLAVGQVFDVNLKTLHAGDAFSTHFDPVDSARLEPPNGKPIDPPNGVRTRVEPAEPCCTLLGGRTAEGLGIHEHQVGGVDVVLLELKRTSGDIITARWEYRNNTEEKKQLTDQRSGWLDPYRLAANAYLLDNANRIKLAIMRDPTNHPVTSAVGRQNSYIFLKPKETMKVWAKFQAPDKYVKKVTVAIPGVEPFEDVPIGE